MKPHGMTDRLQGYPASLPVALLALFVALCVVGLVSGTAQSPQDTQAAPAQEEREFKNTVPAHVPVKIRIKNEKSFKDRGNKKWFREFEVEVKNTGDKPIYFLYLVLSMPDVRGGGGNPIGTSLIYGRRELWLRDTQITPEDVPIQPGESVTLKAPASQVRGYEKTRDAEGRPDPKKVELLLQAVDFGDGTGFRYTDGTPVLRTPKKVSAGESGPTQRAASKNIAPPINTAQKNCSAQPATFSRVNFFKATEIRALSSFLMPRDIYGCQNSPTCFFVKDGQASCPCDPPEHLEPSIVSANLGETGAGCRQTFNTDKFCETQNGILYCQ